MICQIVFQITDGVSSVSFSTQLHHFLKEGILTIVSLTFLSFRALWSYVNSCLTLVKVVRPGEEESAAQNRRSAGWQVGGAPCHSSTSEPRWSALIPDGSGRPSTWDNLALWDNRLEEPILLPPALSMASQFPKSNTWTWAAHRR